jgi:GNAT superfamily N-acetyltransferase
VTDLLGPSAATALLDASKAAFAVMLAGMPGAGRHGGDGLWWVDTGVADPEFNGVYTAPDSGDDHEYGAAAAEAITYFRKRGLPFHWQTGLRPEPVDAGEILVKHGLQHIEDEPGMWLDLSSVTDAPPRGDLEIRPVKEETALREWMRVWGGGGPTEIERRWFETYRQLPYRAGGALRMFVGYRAGTPVAICYLHLTGSVAAVHYVVTAGRFRRQGIGAAMTTAALHRARDAGARIAVLTSSPDGLNIYRGLGFRECCEVGTYHWYPGLWETPA